MGRSKPKQPLVVTSSLPKPPSLNAEQQKEFENEVAWAIRQVN
jgi:hypothetical protein